LPYFLQEKGYDIWLGNNRGSPPSKKHVSKNPKKENGDFWDFCMDDFVKYDIVSEINYIKKHTGAKKVDFIGYSEGSTLFLMLYMDNPNFVENSINKFVSIGTVPNLSDIPTSVTDLIDKVSYYLKIKEFFSKVFYIDDKARTALLTSVEKSLLIYIIIS
jgi:lysosomal acid lipase/cholesteryl ester hydrolase